MEPKHIILEHAILPAKKLPQELHNGVINMFNWYKNRIPDSCQVSLYSDGQSIVLSRFESGMYNIIFSNDAIQPIAVALKKGGQAMGLIKGITKKDEKIILLIDVGFLEPESTH